MIFMFYMLAMSVMIVMFHMNFMLGMIFMFIIWNMRVIINMSKIPLRPAQPIESDVRVGGTTAPLVGPTETY